MTRVLAAVVLLVASSVPAGAQPAPPDDASRLVRRLEAALEQHDPALYTSLLARGADRDKAARFAADWFLPAVTRAVIRERDRAGTPADGEYELYVDVLIEMDRAARLGTWRIVVRREAGEPPLPPSDDQWRIGDQDVISTMEGLDRLALNPARQYTVTNFTIRAEDLELRLPQGTAFVADTPDGPTAIVLLGRGDAIFSPAPESERGQLRIFCGSETLRAPFDALFIRVKPDEIDQHLSLAEFRERAVDPRDLRRAEDVFRRDIVRSYHLDLGDLSREVWSATPRTGDFLAEIWTRRYSELTYAQFTNEPEDIQLFEREGRRTISIYASKARLAARGPFYDEDDDRDYDVVDYDIEASLQPARAWIDGRARLLVRTLTGGLTTLVLRLADPLAVQSVASRRFGRLLSLRVAGQDQIVITLPEPVPRDTVLDLEVAYAGRLPAVPPEREVLGAPQAGDNRPLDSLLLRLEPSYVYSSRSYWHPQGMVSDYATATLRLRVPADYDCVASGVPDEESPTLIAPEEPGGIAWKEYLFRATQPARYLGWATSRLVRVESLLVAPEGADRRNVPAWPGLPGVSYSAVQLTVDANPAEAKRARGVAQRAQEVVRFYSSVIGDIPYPALALVLVQRDLPGGHSPPYFALVNQPPLVAPIVWHRDPANFAGFPDFFLAHEVAHQWWGQAVGWKNFHEQWLSEGLAQYFAALFAERFRGADVLAGIVRQMRAWTMRDSGQGPVYLGYRLGHLRRDGRAFRAVVYNKGALVLHMMRRLIGDEAFFRAIRRFYATWRFRKAGTEDLKRAFEAETDRSFDRFFERWIYGSTLPKIRFSYQADGDAVVLRFEQLGELFDLPVTVTLDYVDRPSTEVTVPITEQVAEVRLPIAGALRRVEVNRDEAAPAEFVR